MMAHDRGTIVQGKREKRKIKLQSLVLIARVPKRRPKLKKRTLDLSLVVRFIPVVQGLGRSLYYSKPVS